MNRGTTAAYWLSGPLGQGRNVEVAQADGRHPVQLGEDAGVVLAGELADCVRRPRVRWFASLGRQRPAPPYTDDDDDTMTRRTPPRGRRPTRSASRRRSSGRSPAAARPSAAPSPGRRGGTRCRSPDGGSDRRHVGHVTLDRRARWSTFSRDPVERSSRTTTSAPAASRASTRCDPMKPAPPVTSAFTPTSPVGRGGRRAHRCAVLLHTVTIDRLVQVPPQRQADDPAATRSVTGRSTASRWAYAVCRWTGG